MSDFGVRHAQISDQTEIAKMCVLLWPDTSMEEHHQEIGHLLKSGMSGTLPAAILVSHEDVGALTGFLQVGLRSHADGCDTAQPVGLWKAGSSTNPFGVRASAQP
jgi:aminoglycoside 6'-N-acetyltransferase I